MRGEAIEDAPAMGFVDRNAVPARLGRDGQRRVRVGVLARSGRCANPRKVRHGQFRDGGTREACEQALPQKLASDSENDTDMDVTADRQASRPRLWVRRKGHPEPLPCTAMSVSPTPWTRAGRRVNVVALP